MGPMERLAHLVIRRRRRIFLAWIGLTIFGMIGAGQVSNRWAQDFSIPGYSAYETNQKALKTFGTGEQMPLVLAFHSAGDITKQPGIAKAVAAAVKENPGSRASSYFSTGSDAYVSADGHTTFAEVYPAGQQNFNFKSTTPQTLAATRAATPAGVDAHVTGTLPLVEAEGGANGPSLGVEIAIGGGGALLILLFVFGTLPAVVMPLVIAACSILTTFGLVWLLTYITDVSIIVQFLIALIGLGVAIDYALLMIFRFREELAGGADVDAAITKTMQRAGRSVVVSGSTVAIGLLSMLVIPLPFIRAIGIGGMLIPAVSVLASITLLPALLSKLGTRINSVRLLPARFHAGEYVDTGFWARWARLVNRRPALLAGIGLAIVALLLIPASKLNPSQAQAADLPGAGDAFAGRDLLASSGITPGVYEPFSILVQGDTSTRALATVVSEVNGTPGIAGAVAPPGSGWRKGDSAIVEAFPNVDGESKAIRPIIDDLKGSALPAAESKIGGGTTASLGGVAPENRDFVHAVYGNFPFVLLFVVLLTYLLLARAFRSLLLPLKAVLLNLVSLGAAYGIVVFIFQQGHLSDAIWGVQATQAIIAWIPLMIFAFLFGLSMDYEVFMLTRMREAYDQTGSTPQAIQLGLMRTGKLVTSAALVLMFAFFSMSTGPGVDIKQFGIGLAAGIIFDATVIRALLVPAIMRLLGRWNWWLPTGLARVLRVEPSDPVPETT
ncbi:MAG: putative drug exporter of the superfamily [Solirubrobacterales bacterium]|nr:putative drug exporter of the superfamily [Solirubrobacterales bacterium]